MAEDKTKKPEAVVLDDFFSKVLEQIGKITDDQIAELLKKSHKTIATAESVTGGILSARLTTISGSSDYFIGGVVSYHNRIKVSELMVPGSLIAKEGVVSEKVAGAMAEGIRKRFKCDIGLSTTGCAGPLPLPPAPVGQVFIGLADERGSEAKELRLMGTREEIRMKAAQAALGMLWMHLGGGEM